MNVATNAPRVANGAMNAAGIRSVRWPRRTSSMSSQSGSRSIDSMNVTNSGGGAGTASRPSLQASWSMSIRPLKLWLDISVAYGSATVSPSIVAVLISSITRSSRRIGSRSATHAGSEETSSGWVARRCGLKVKSTSP